MANIQYLDILTKERRSYFGDPIDKGVEIDTRCCFN